MRNLLSLSSLDVTPGVSDKHREILEKAEVDVIACHYGINSIDDDLEKFIMRKHIKSQLAIYPELLKLYPVFERYVR